MKSILLLETNNNYRLMNFCSIKTFWFLVISIISMFILCPFNSVGQQDAQVGQYMQNKVFVNPAAAGSNGGNFTIFYRHQWLNLPGAPKTMGAMADIEIPNTGVGVGLNFINTNQAAISYTRILTNFSYKIKLANELNAVYLGLQAGAVQYSVDTKELITHDEMQLDATLNSSNLKKLVPDFGFGAMLKLNTFYFGIAMPHMLQPKIKFINTIIDPTVLDSNKTRNSFAKIFRHYYFTAGGDLYLSQLVTLQPSILLKYIANTPLSADINMNVMISELYWGGVGYRVGKPGAVVFMAGLNIKTLKVGYAYEVTRSPLAYYAGATHELMVNYQFSGKQEVRDSKKPYFIK